MNRAMKLKFVPPRSVRFPLSIGDAADHIGVSREALRFYERQGLVAPIRFGRNQCRLYLPEHIAQIKKYRASIGRR
jgi:DNA-binding transcriptional MerR regulator